MLESWHEFYALLGTAAAALVALLFVAVSIGIGLITAGAGSPTRTYTSPVVFHYTYVLFVSLLALVPINTDRSLALIIGVSAVIALGYSGAICARVLRGTTRDLDDHVEIVRAGELAGAGQLPERVDHGAEDEENARGPDGGGSTLYGLRFSRRSIVVGDRARHVCVETTIDAGGRVETGISRRGTDRVLQT